MSQPTVKKFKARQFRVAVEGATTDGRRIERSWIEQMAKSYNVKTYGARVNVEHLRSVYPGGTFGAYGDVTAVEAKEITEEGDLKGKLALYATIEPLPGLVELAKAKQKVYTSIEINPKFGDTGQAYLTGLAVTDSPASLGTEMLEFSAKAGNNSPLAARKTSPDCLFTEAVEVALAFDEDTPQDDSAAKFTGTIKSLIAKFTGKAQSDDSRFAAVTEGFEAAAGQFAHQAEQIAAASAAADKATADLAELNTKFSALQTAHDQLVTKLGTTDGNHSQRPPATGGGNAVKTDC